MYTNFWNLKEKPFENTPDPRFFYNSKRHEESLMRMLYAVYERKGAAMLSGEYGAGKTLLTRLITSALLKEDHKYNLAIIINPDIPSSELVEEIIYQLGQPINRESRKIDRLRELNRILYETAQQGRHTVIIIDEAQAIMDQAIFEELRLLLNFQLNERFLLTLVLFGQPELREKVNALPQFAQRLAVKYHLVNFNPEETQEYIRHRCQIAGSIRPIFTDEACQILHRGAGGIPRLINNLCDIALLTGYGKRVQEIDGALVREVVKDIMGVEVA
jgi:general secretion pathway protein A